MLRELWSDKVVEEARQSVVQETVKEMISEDEFIDSVEKVQQRIRDEVEVEVKPAEIYKVLKNDFNMSFRKVKHLSLHANSNTNLVLR